MTLFLVKALLFVFRLIFFQDIFKPSLTYHHTPYDTFRFLSPIASFPRPFVHFYPSGEMVYILEQRLHAQNIPEKKSVRVLRDVVKTMYNPKFVRGLFVPQKPQTMKQTLEVFNNLAHSSIMRLNESSMGKLFDLMTMGVKYQLLQATDPCEYIQVTLNHLESLKLIVNDQAVGKLLDSAAANCVALYQDMSPGNLMLLHQTVSDYFQDRHVKVSIFLQEDVQNSNGSFKIMASGPVPPGAMLPGDAIYFTSRGQDRREGKMIHLPLSGRCAPALCVNGLHTRSTMLGLNMYAKAENGQLSRAASLSMRDAGLLSLKGKKWKAANGGSEVFIPSSAQQKGGSGFAGANDVDREAAQKEIEEATRNRNPRKRADGRMELNVLASLLGRAVQETEGKTGSGADGQSGDAMEAFKLNLFAEDPFAAAAAEEEDSHTLGGGASKSSSGSRRVHVSGADTRDRSLRDEMAGWDLSDDSGRRGSSNTAGSKSNSNEAGGKTAGGKSRSSDSEGSGSDDDLLGLLDEAANHK